jgi:hypothetical protein
MKQEERQEELIKSYKRLFESEDGQVVLYDMMQAGHMLAHNHSSDPYTSAFKEGERNAILRVLTILETDIHKLREQMKQYSAQREQWHV